jgi:hypothetical protein
MRGRAFGYRPLRVPHRPSKDATAICHKCIIITGGYPSSAIRCGPSYTTLIVERQMVRLLRHDFSGGRFQISLKRCYPRSKPYRSRGDENTR